MAKKKKTAAKKANKGRSPKKASTKKASPKKKPAITKKESTKRSGGRGTSVDSLLKKYEKERKAQEAKLSASLKKIDDLESKAKKLEEQIAQLKEASKATRAEIDQLDSRRDADVAEVLSKLGVQLSAGSAATSSDPKPTLTLGTNLPPKIDDGENR